MFDAFVRGILGESGSAILDLYIANSFWINTVILAYVLVLVFARRGYNKIIQAIKNDLISQFGDDAFVKSENNFKKAMEQVNLNWDALAKSTRMPIISANRSFFFKIKSPEVLKNHFSAEKVYGLMKQGKDQPRT